MYTDHYFLGNLFPRKIIHLLGSKANESMGAVRRHLRSSAGCCNKTTVPIVLSGFSGNAEHQHTLLGLLKSCEIIGKFLANKLRFIYLQSWQILRLAGGSDGSSERSAHSLLSSHINFAGREFPTRGIENNCRIVRNQNKNRN